MKRTTFTYLILALLVITALAFFIFNMNEIIGIIFLVLAIIIYISNNKKWGDKFQGELGIALFSGLIISLTRDLVSNSLNRNLQIMYFIGIAVAVLLLMKGASKGEKI